MEKPAIPQRKSSLLCSSNLHLLGWKHPCWHLIKKKFACELSSTYFHSTDSQDQPGQVHDILSHEIHMWAISLLEIPMTTFHLWYFLASFLHWRSFIFRSSLGKKGILSYILLSGIWSLTLTSVLSPCFIYMSLFFFIFPYIFWKPT